MCGEVADRVISGEYVAALVEWVEDGAPGVTRALGRPATEAETSVPARDLLPALDRYAKLERRDALHVVAAVDTSHGCSHRCRHCPVPVVYDGRVRLVDETAVLDDIAQVVAAGAEHISFGDPDFLNAPGHALRIVRAMHERFPEVTFDCTVKVEHILRHADCWDEMAAAGCQFVVSAFESIDDTVLARLDKGHTAADAGRATALLRSRSIDVRPSFLPFTPWTTRAGLVALLDFVHRHDLVGSVDPVQYTVRLLLPTGSLLLDHPDLLAHLGEWDQARLSYSWSAAVAEIDTLHQEVAEVVERSIAEGDGIVETYRLVRVAVGAAPVDLQDCTVGRPRLTESWFCCAEPTDVQLRAVSSRGAR
jgi:hypothetical protein